MDLTFRVVRDLFSPEVDEFVVDDAAAHEKCLGYVRALVPSLESRVKLYSERAPVFDAFGIEKDIEKALRRRVWLKSGGYIVIDHTEALVSIDVNTGKYVGKRDFEQTVLKINLEAVNEVIRQIRLRDLGGIIIIDFIDMEVLEHREQVEKAIKRALAEDKARTNVMPISELGLVEMTRKRVRQDLRALLTQHCPVCRGTGVVKSDETLATEIYRAVQAKAAAEAPPGEGREIIARVHPDVAAYIEREGRADLERLESGLQVKITMQGGSGQSPREEYEIRVR
jgi:ribonuclease G